MVLLAKTKKQKSYYKGLLAEEMAELLLRVKGYKILERRFKTPIGEIDLICKKKNLLVIVEVKERKTINEALQAVSENAKGRIAHAASYYRAAHPKHENDTIRFDLIAVHMPFLVKHLLNAW